MSSCPIWALFILPPYSFKCLIAHVIKTHDDHVTACRDLRLGPFILKLGKLQDRIMRCLAQGSNARIIIRVSWCSRTWTTVIWPQLVTYPHARHHCLHQVEPSHDWAEMDDLVGPCYIMNCVRLSGKSKLNGRGYPLTTGDKKDIRSHSWIIEPPQPFTGICSCEVLLLGFPINLEWIPPVLTHKFEWVYISGIYNTLSVLHQHRAPFRTTDLCPNLKAANGGGSNPVCTCYGLDVRQDIKFSSTQNSCVRKYKKF